jgi:hypothetical protein
MKMRTGFALLRICSVKSFYKHGNGITIKGAEFIDQLNNHRLYKMGICLSNFLRLLILAFKISIKNRAQ